MRKIFIDSNIPMYLVGAEHPNKTRCVAQLRELLLANAVLVSDAEVFQEILHRYVSINRRDAIRPAFDALSQILTTTYPIEQDDVVDAAGLLGAYSGLSARDAIHATVMSRQGVSEIFSFDRGFDALPAVSRLS